MLRSEDICNVSRLGHIIKSQVKCILILIATVTLSHVW